MENWLILLKLAWPLGYFIKRYLDSDPKRKIIARLRELRYEVSECREMGKHFGMVPPETLKEEVLKLITERTLLLQRCRDKKQKRLCCMFVSAPGYSEAAAEIALLEEQLLECRRSYQEMNSRTPSQVQAMNLEMIFCGIRSLESEIEELNRQLGEMM